MNSVLKGGKICVLEQGKYVHLSKAMGASIFTSANAERLGETQGYGLFRKASADWVQKRVFGLDSNLV